MAPPFAVLLHVLHPVDTRVTAQNCTAIITISHWFVIRFIIELFFRMIVSRATSMPCHLIDAKETKNRRLL
jgi:sulfur relay (sulfurtransferase) DsrC/TusE family protein